MERRKVGVLGLRAEQKRLTLQLLFEPLKVGQDNAARVAQQGD